MAIAGVFWEQSMHRAAVILVTFNSERTIRSSIQSVVDNTPSDMPIVVVDNCSTDDTLVIVAEFGCRVQLVFSPKNVGFGAANNLGMRAVAAHFYYLHNVDAYLNDGSLEIALCAMEADPTIGVAGLSLIYPDGRPQISAYAFSSPLKWSLQLLHVQDVYHVVARGPLKPMLTKLARKSPFSKVFTSIVEGDIVAPLTVDWVTGAALVLSRTAFNRTAGFDEEIFLYSEDEDLCRRVGRSGFRVVLVHNRPFIHELGWNTKKGSTEYSSVKFASKQVFIRKHFFGWKFIAMSVLLRLKRATNVD